MRLIFYIILWICSSIYFCRIKIHEICWQFISLSLNWFEMIKMKCGWYTGSGLWRLKIQTMWNTHPWIWLMLLGELEGPWLEFLVQRMRRLSKCLSMKSMCSSLINLIKLLVTCSSFRVQPTFGLIRCSRDFFPVLVKIFCNWLIHF